MKLEKKIKKRPKKKNQSQPVLTFKTRDISYELGTNFIEGKC